MRSRGQSCDYSPYGCVEPDVEDFLSESLQRYGCAPTEVATDAARFERVSDPRRRNVESILRPYAWAERERERERGRDQREVKQREMEAPGFFLKGSINTTFTLCSL